MKTKERKRLPTEEGRRFGARLAFAREEAGYGTQVDAAKALGVKPQQWNEWETGIRPPRPKTLAKITQKLKLKRSAVELREGWRDPQQEQRLRIYETGGIELPPGYESLIEGMEEDKKQELLELILLTRRSPRIPRHLIALLREVDSQGSTSLDKAD